MPIVPSEGFLLIILLCTPHAQHIPSRNVLPPHVIRESLSCGTACIGCLLKRTAPCAIVCWWLIHSPSFTTTCCAALTVNCFMRIFLANICGVPTTYLLGSVLGTSQVLTHEPHQTPLSSPSLQRQTDPGPRSRWPGSRGDGLETHRAAPGHGLCATSLLTDGGFHKPQDCISPFK